MDSNNQKQNRGNDILRDASDNKNSSLSGDFGNDTIVFHKAYKQTNQSRNDDMNHTAQIKGGAVVRPLKKSQDSSENPANSQDDDFIFQIESVKNTNQNSKSDNGTKSKKQGVFGNILKKAEEFSASKIMPLFAEDKKQKMQTGANRTVKPQAQQKVDSTVAAKPHAVENRTVKPQAQQKVDSTVAAKPHAVENRTVKPQAQQRFDSTVMPKPNAMENRTVKPQPKQKVDRVEAPKPQAGTNHTVKPSNLKNESSKSSMISPAKPNRSFVKTPAPNPADRDNKYASNTIKPGTARSENDDFEIDEMTWAPPSKRKEYDGNNNYESASGAVISLIKAMVYIIVVIAVSVGISVFVINTANDVFKFVVEDKIVTVTVPENATIDDVTNLLYDSGAIKYKWAFKLWSNLKDPNAKFIPGTYEISTSLNYDYLRSSFKKSTVRSEVRITIPEGYTIDEIIALFVENGIGTKEGFVDVINNYDFDYPFLEGLVEKEGRIYRLEGYLFPDTYYFFTDSSEVAVIKKLLNNFNNKFVDEYYTRCEQLGFSIDDAIILASMVEKETRYADELGYVSSVFHNRLKYSATFPYLNSDATIMYAMAHDLGGRPETMEGEDKEYDSLYNTYKYRGLPPGPIANPGLNAIKYALYPNATDYFFFVSNSQGRTLFAKTEPEHLANINTVRGYN